MISISWGAGHFMLHDIPHAPRLFEARSRPLACALFRRGHFGSPMNPHAQPRTYPRRRRSRTW